MNLGSGDSIASKPIAKRVIPIIVLRREPFLDEPPLSGEVLARPPQADLRRFVSLTENDHTPHMGRNPNMAAQCEWQQPCALKAATSSPNPAASSKSNSSKVSRLASRRLDYLLL